MSKHPESQLTLSELFERHYFKDDIRPNSLEQIRIALRCWEAFTGNIAVGDVDNQTVAEFRQAMLDAGLAPATIKSRWGHIRAAFRRIGPPLTGNSLGLLIVNKIPAMRPVKRQHKLPRRLTMDELNDAYLAARQMTLPKLGYPAAFVWQSLLVLLYTTGLRISDALSVEWDDVDQDNATLHIVTSKTGIEAELPLHDVLIAHLKRQRRLDGDGRIFPLSNSKHFRDLWNNRLMQTAGTDFRPHDIRRTACSEVDRVERGMGKVLLLHAPANVTEQSYLNALPDLRRVIDLMEMPLAFKHGVRMAERKLQQDRHQRILMNAEKFGIPQKAIAGEFTFIDGGFSYGGKLYRLEGRSLEVLRLLVESAGPVTYAQMFEAAYPDIGRLNKAKRQRRIEQRLWHLRKRLRAVLGLPEGYNPVPVVHNSRWNGGETTFTLVLQ